jgi:hypothetical protein
MVHFFYSSIGFWVGVGYTGIGRWPDKLTAGIEEGFWFQALRIGLI